MKTAFASIHVTSARCLFAASIMVILSLASVAATGAAQDNELEERITKTPLFAYRN
jgi:hypothetical protein